MESFSDLGEKEWLACCGSTKFAQEMASAGPFSNFQQALDVATDIWFNKVSFQLCFLSHSKYVLFCDVLVLVCEVLVLVLCCLGGCEWMVGSLCCSSFDWSEPFRKQKSCQCSVSFLILYFVQTTLLVTCLDLCVNALIFLSLVYCWFFESLVCSRKIDQDVGFDIQTN